MNMYGSQNLVGDQGGQGRRRMSWGSWILPALGFFPLYMYCWGALTVSSTQNCGLCDPGPGEDFSAGGWPGAPRPAWSSGAQHDFHTWFMLSLCKFIMLPTSILQQTRVLAFFANCYWTIYLEHLGLSMLITESQGLNWLQYLMWFTTLTFWSLASQSW